MHQNDWKEIRWKEGLELFYQLLETVKDYDEQDYLGYTVRVVSKRLFNVTWAKPIN